LEQMKTYRTKPCEIQAFKWDGDSTTANHHIGDRYGVDWEYAGKEDSAIIIPTLEGRLRGEIGDYIVKGLKGEFYPVKPDIFAMKYELANA